jgi:glycosyltransferase involved in cell wall biosynthesis
MGQPSISIVIPARNETSHLQSTVECIRATSPPDAEIIVVDDECGDDGLAAWDVKVVRTQNGESGVTHARNAGAKAACGEILVFADAHITTPHGWWEPLCDLLQRPEVGAVAPVISVMGKPEVKGYGLRLTGPDLNTEWLRNCSQTPYPAPLLPGCCLAIRRATFMDAGELDSGLIRWGMTDVEFSIRLWLLGYELLVVPTVEVEHLFRSKHPYPVEWRAILHNKLRTAALHFNPDRFARVVDTLKPHAHFSHAAAELVTRSFEQRRSALHARRVRDDEWFFSNVTQNIAF